jgi:hypothetical protein
MQNKYLEIYEDPLSFTYIMVPYIQYVYIGCTEEVLLLVLPVW